MVIDRFVQGQRKYRTLRGLAKALGVDRRTMHRWAAAGKIPKPHALFRRDIQQRVAAYTEREAKEIIATVIAGLL